MLRFSKQLVHVLRFLLKYSNGFITLQLEHIKLLDFKLDKATQERSSSTDDSELRLDLALALLLKRQFLHVLYEKLKHLFSRNRLHVEQ